MENQCENGRFLMARNHVSHYTLRLFHTFAIFEKSQKMDAKRDAQSHTFGWKNGPRASLVRPKTALYSISESSEKRWFFGVISERPKIDKKKHVGASRAQKSHWLCEETNRRANSRNRGPQAGGQLSKKSMNRWKKTTRIEGEVLTRRWAVGPANFRF